MHDFIGDGSCVVILVGNAKYRIVVLAGKNQLFKSRFASRLNSDFRMAEGALNPEFEVGEVKATFFPLSSAGVLIELSTAR